jgi:Family of unknown function (DUF5681)
MTDKPQNDHETNKNTANNSEGYEVGYRKPPKHKKCKKESGIPKGRRKRHQTENCGDLFDRISNEKITIYENGRATCVRGRPLLAESIVNRGIAGHPECENMLIKIERPDLTPPAGGVNIVDVDSEDEIPARTRELLGRKRRPTNTSAPSPARFGRGRPRHDAPFPELVKRELNKRIKVEENGRTLTMTKREFWMRRLWNDVINGKPRALRIYSKLAKPTEPPGGINFFIVGGR